MPTVEALAQSVRDCRASGRKCVVHAESAEQAVEVAQRLLELGEAQWFRGQIQDWPKLIVWYTLQ